MTDGTYVGVGMVKGWSADGLPADDWLKEVHISPSEKFCIGDTVKVDSAIGLNVRTDPPELGVKEGEAASDGMEGEVVDGPFYGIPKGETGFYHCWKVDYGSTVGWSAQDWLEYVPKVKPTATIDSITPDPAEHGEDTVKFRGHGSDSDGSVVGYNWRSSKDGFLSDKEDFDKSASDFSLGDHTIYFKVEDNDGLWSTEVTDVLTIAKNTQPTATIDSITPDPSEHGEDTVKFRGHGSDSDGSVVGYNWRSSKDGFLSDKEDFDKSASDFSLGDHTIYFKVEDNDGLWSTEVTDVLTIQQQKTGSITVTTNLDQATFTITGPKTYSGSGKSWSASDAMAGTYTIVYNEVSGYTTPSSETKILGAGDSITFSGTYTKLPDIGYAVLVAGDAGVYENWWVTNNAETAYHALRGLGFDDERILYLSNNPKDVDGDGHIDVDKPSSYDDFEFAMVWARERVGGNSPFIRNYSPPTAKFIINEIIFPS